MGRIENKGNGTKVQLVTLLKYALNEVIPQRSAFTVRDISYSGQESEHSDKVVVLLRRRLDSGEYKDKYIGTAVVVKLSDFAANPDATTEQLLVDAFTATAEFLRDPDKATRE